MLLLPLLLAACGREDGPARGGAGGDAARARCPAPCALDALTATSLAAPVRAALDSFARRTGARVSHESGGSLELARRVTSLGRTPDLIALADEEVFPALLMPAHVRWYAAFARNRMVLAYTDRSRGAAAVGGERWWEALLAPGVETARSDPARDPMGYRTLMLFQLAERHHGVPGLAERLRRAASERHLRPKSSEVVALLQAGEVDYAWTYESVARAAGTRWRRLPAAIDLGDAADSARYASVAVRIPGRSPRDTVEVRGAPIRYAVAVPVGAASAELAVRFVEWLLSPEGRSVLRAHGLEPLEPPVIAGDAPTAVRRAAGAVTAGGSARDSGAGVPR